VPAVFSSSPPTSSIHRRRFERQQGARRAVSEKEREWSTLSHPSCYGHSPVQRNAAGSPASATTSTQCFQTGYLVRVLSRLIPHPHVSYMLLDIHHLFLSPSGYLSFTLDLKALPPSPTGPSPTQASPYCLWRSTEMCVSPYYGSTCKHWLTQHHAFLIAFRHALSRPCIIASEMHPIGSLAWSLAQFPSAHQIPWNVAGRFLISSSPQIRILFVSIIV
jgi:hypothetical protein